METTDLVRVDGDTRDTIDAEIERWQRVACVFHEGQKESAQTSVHVNGYVILATQGGYLFDGIDDAVRETRCRTDQLNTRNIKLHIIWYVISSLGVVKLSWLRIVTFLP